MTTTIYKFENNLYDGFVRNDTIINGERVFLTKEQLEDALSVYYNNHTEIIGEEDNSQQEFLAVPGITWNPSFNWEGRISLIEYSHTEKNYNSGRQPVLFDEAVDIINPNRPERWCEK